jgi:serine/threonine protein phosphatase 1
MLKNFFRRFQSAAPFPDIVPQTSFVALGDIHGRHDLLMRFLDTEPAHQIICVGDYIDRGDHSADVLRTLHARPDIICLSGNHEEMMLNFLDAPAKHGNRWLRYGGLQTMASFGVYGVTEASRSEALTSARDKLANAMGDDLITWVRTRLARWQSGNVAVVHAGADPTVAIEDQATRTLYWGHPDFEKKQREDGVWVVHGHTIVDEAHATNGRIAIDTGAYATGVLTAAVIDKNGLQFQTIT